MEKIAEVIDTLENLIEALKLPVPDHIHVTAFRDHLPELKDKLKGAYLDAGGDDVWCHGDKK